MELLLPRVGDDGGGFITTEVVPAVLVHPAAEVADTEYVPASEVVVTAIVGFCEAEVKLLGPVHAYVAPVELAVSESEFPSQSGALLDAAGAAGVGLIVTTVVPAGPVHPFSLAVTEYVPLPAVEIAAITGF